MMALGAFGLQLTKLVSLFSLLLGAASIASALDNGVGKTPAMGWNSWNYFRCNINETIIKQVADAIVSSGLKDAGYTYVNIDDCWMEKRDPATGRIQPFKDKFPSGMKALGDYIHGLGLKFGIYSDTGNHTCEGYPGSWGYEKLDAATYAEWGVDYLKYDYCGMEGVTEPVRASYERMRDALAATGRPVLFSLCSWGSGQPWQWGKQVGNSWRTGIDVFAVWDAAQARALQLPSFLQPILGAVRQTQALAPYAGPGGFNDPDMLVVGLEGMYPYGIVQECPEHVRGCKPGMYISRDRWGKVGGLTQTEQRTHFSFWCMMAAPLILGNDPRVMSKATLQILLAREVLAVNQDALGAQGKPVWTGSSKSSKGSGSSSKNGGSGSKGGSSSGAPGHEEEQHDLEIWAKPLADCRTALMLVNLGDSAADISTLFSRDLPSESGRWAREVPHSDPTCKDKHAQCGDWAAAGECKRNEGFMLDACPLSCPDGCPHPVDPPGPKATALVRDLWLEEDVGVFTGRFTALKVEPHEARLVTLKWMEPADAAALSSSLDFGPRALAASVRAAAEALGLGAAPGEGGQQAAGGRKGADKAGRQHFLRAKELETEVQRLHNEVKKRDRQMSEMQKELDAVQCSKEHAAAQQPADPLQQQQQQQQAAAAAAAAGSNSGGGGGATDLAALADSAALRRSAISGTGTTAESGSGSGSSGVVRPAVWLSWTQSKISLALNVVLAVLLGLLVAQQRRRRVFVKSSRDLQ